VKDSARTDLGLERKRSALLRIKKGQPLDQLFAEVFGPDGGPLLDRLRVIEKSRGGGGGEAFEIYCRRILRHCGRIPATTTGMNRRRAYVRKCISELDTERPSDNGPLGGSAPGPIELVRRISRKTGVSTDTIWKYFWDLFSIYEQSTPTSQVYPSCFAK